MATQTVAYYQELYEANLPYEGDATKCANALKALLMLRQIRAQSMGSAGSNLTFSPYDDEIKRLQSMTVALSNATTGASFTRVRPVRS